MLQKAQATNAAPHAFRIIVDSGFLIIVFLASASLRLKVGLGGP